MSKAEIVEFKLNDAPFLEGRSTKMAYAIYQTWKIFDGRE